METLNSKPSTDSWEHLSALADSAFYRRLQLCLDICHTVILIVRHTPQTLLMGYRHDFVPGC